MMLIDGDWKDIVTGIEIPSGYLINVQLPGGKPSHWLVYALKLPIAQELRLLYGKFNYVAV